jgi:hypothetical protein
MHLSRGARHIGENRTHIFRSRRVRAIPALREKLGKIFLYNGDYSSVTKTRELVIPWSRASKVFSKIFPERSLGLSTASCQSSCWNALAFIFGNIFSLRSCPGILPKSASPGRVGSVGMSQYTIADQSYNDILSRGCSDEAVLDSGHHRSGSVEIRLRTMTAAASSSSFDCATLVTRSKNRKNSIS